MEHVTPLSKWTHRLVAPVAAAIVAGVTAMGLVDFTPRTLAVVQQADPRAGSPPAPATEPAPARVVARKPVLSDHGHYPCSECHDESMPADPKERALTEAHDEIPRAHGAAKFWCFTCHDPNDRDRLHDLAGQPVDFDDSVALCGQCHFDRARDFRFGAHGKRTETWRGERVALACTACHDAHAPRIAPKKPQLVPGVLVVGSAP